VGYLRSYGNPLSPQWQDKKREDIHALNAQRREEAARRIQRAWFRYWFLPNSDGEAPCAKRSYIRDIVPLLL
jgi:hypothetical protein